MPTSDIASSAPKAARASGTSAASELPATTASARPERIISTDSPSECEPAEHAESGANDGPRSPWRMLTAPAPALPIMSGIESGETFFAPSSSIT